jgi:hypothetical protein
MNSDEIRNVKRLYSALLCVCVWGRISKIRPFTFISTIFYFIFISSCCACALVNIDIVIESAVLHQASAAVVVAQEIMFSSVVPCCCVGGRCHVGLFNILMKDTSQRVVIRCCQPKEREREGRRNNKKKQNAVPTAVVIMAKKVRAANRAVACRNKRERFAS